MIRIGDKKLVKALINNYSPGLFGLKFSLLSIAFAAGVVTVMDLRKPGGAEGINRKGIDGFVGLEIGTTKTCEQRKAEGDEDQRQPGPAEPHALIQVTSDQILGMLILSMESGLSSACARKAGRSRSDLKPMWTVNGEIARSNHATTAFGLRK